MPDTPQKELDGLERHMDYILEETQGVGISFEGEGDGEGGVAGNARTAVVVEGCEIGVGLVPLL